MGNMAQIAQKRLYFTFTEAGSDTENDTNDVYLDIAAALSAVNRKQYHQVTANGDPLCYTVTVKALASSKMLSFTTAANTWTTKNAAKKVAVGWKEQLKNSGVRMSELPTYARRFRCAFEYGAFPSGANQQSLQNHMVPDEAGGKRLFTPYEGQDPAAVDISYFNSNEIVMLAVAADPNPDEGSRCALLGKTDKTNTSFGMIYEYLKSRRNMRSRSDPEVEFPDTDGLLNTIFATSESLADDVTVAVDDYNIARPYSELGNVGAVPERDNACEPVLGAMVAPDTPNYSETFSAPLGLIKMSGFGLADGDQFFVDVEAVYEM